MSAQTDFILALGHIDSYSTQMVECSTFTEAVEGWG